MDAIAGLEAGSPEPAAADPLAGFSNMQWYMYHQENVVFYAAFSTLPIGAGQLAARLQALLRLAPHLRNGFAGGGPDYQLDAETAGRLVTLETVDSFDGLPDARLGHGMDVFDGPALPLLRATAYTLRDGPDARGRHTLLVVRISHALVEGVDSAMLSRGRVASHAPRAAAGRAPLPIRAAATLTGAFGILFQLLATRLVDFRPGPYVFRTSAYPRAPLVAAARRMGVRTRSLLFALVLAAQFGAGTRRGKRRITCTHSVLDQGGGSVRDEFMQMRMLLSVFPNAPDFEHFVKRVEAVLDAAGEESIGFNSELNAAALRMHRRLHGLIPWAYSPRVFHFMPYDFILGFIPPHRLGGPLTEGLVEPVYSGAATPGGNACVIVPGEEFVSFNFYIQESLVPRAARLDGLIKALEV